MGEPRSPERWFRFGCMVWRWLADHWSSEDGWDLAEFGVSAGLAERVIYDPDKHGECEAEPGDEIIWPIGGDPDFDLFRRFVEDTASTAGAEGYAAGMERAEQVCRERVDKARDSFENIEAEDCADAIRAERLAGEARKAEGR